MFDFLPEKGYLIDSKYRKMEGYIYGKNRFDYWISGIWQDDIYKEICKIFAG